MCLESVRVMRAIGLVASLLAIDVHLKLEWCESDLLAVSQLD
jgi:hypothetical protein